MEPIDWNTDMSVAVENPYPWYDSQWMMAYTYACRVIEERWPDRLAEFQEALAPLRTSADFTTTRFASVFDEATLDELCAAVDALRRLDVKSYEKPKFGRFIVHDHPLVTSLQNEVVELVSDAAGERVEACYNFISLYRAGGICEVHMDTPEAKWTLDLCLRQSDAWPIHISQVVDWPVERTMRPEQDWEAEIKATPGLEFESYALEPGEAVQFSGSSQWHYRDLQPGGSSRKFCDLVFFHFVPAGMGELVHPANWADLFGLPDLGIRPV